VVALAADGACHPEVPVRAKRSKFIFFALFGAAMLWPAQASAQHVRLFVSGGYFARPAYFGYSPFFYDPFFYGVGWSQWYPYPYPYPYPPPYYYGRRYDISEARLEIKPREAQVYVDGYYVGVVNDFDGAWQRLDLPPGEHEITVYLQGYQTYRQRTFFRPGQDYHFKAILEPLPPGTAQEPPPQPPQQPPAPAGNRGYYPPPRAGEPRRMPPPRQAPRGETNGFGTLSLQVQPADASITIDGERWDSPEGGSRLIVQLAAGPHRVEVQKEGLRTYTSTVTVRPGETQSLNISLVRE
jgi:hypothetical protein